MKHENSPLATIFTLVPKFKLTQRSDSSFILTNGFKAVPRAFEGDNCLGGHYEETSYSSRHCDGRF